MSVKVTGLTALNVAALREVFPTAIENGDLRLTATTATVDVCDFSHTLAHAMSGLPGRGHPRHSLHAVLRKFRKAELAASTPPETITFEADGTTKVAVVGPPAVPVKDAMIREYDGVKYAILIPLGSIPGYPDAHYIARPVELAS